MSVPPPPLPAELLQRHAKGLRALARGLLRDEHAAEDVVQETWTLALGKPPRDRAHAGSWLRQVALSLALKRRRGEGRRALREQRVARREETPGVDETVAHREVLRCVTDAVLGLEEPYQTAVILRYYEDLSPREIARRLGVPVATVDSQLHRARATLRRRLTARTGDRDGWMHALAALTGWRGRVLTTAGTATLGGIPMFIKLTLGLATAGLLWTGLVPANGSGAPVTSPPAGRTPGTAPARASGSSALQGGAAATSDAARDGAGRVAVETADGAARSVPRALGRHEFTLRGVVVDEEEQPLAGTTVLIAPTGQPLNDGGVTGFDGSFELRWRGSSDTLEITLGLSGMIDPFALRRIALSAGEPRSVRLVARRDRTSAMLAHRKAVLGELERKVAAGGGAEERIELEVEKVHAESMLHRRFVGLLETARAVEPLPGDRFRFRWFGLHEAVEVELARSASQSLRTRELVEKHDVRVAGRVIARTKRASPGVRVEGIVRAGGAPAASVPVLVLGAERAWRTQTDDEGRYSVLVDDTRTVRVLAGGGACGQDATTLDLAGKLDQTLHWDAALDRGTELVGTAHAEGGAPLAYWLVDFVADDGTTHWSKAATTVDGGAFALPNVPEGAGRLVIRAADGPPLAQAIVPNVRTGSTLAFTLAEADLATGDLRVAVLGPDGAAAADAEVVLWQESSDLGVALERSEDGTFALAKVPAGAYTLVAGDSAHGYRTLPALVEAGRTTDLGSLTIDAAGTLTIDIVESDALAAGSLRALLLRRDSPAETVVDDGHFESGGSRALPAGRYVLFLAGDGIALAPLRFEVEAGRSTTLALDLGSYRPLDVELAALAEASPEQPLRWALVDPSGDELATYEATSPRPPRLWVPGDGYSVR